MNQPTLHDIVRLVVEETRAAALHDHCGYADTPEFAAECYAMVLAGLATDATGMIVEIGSNTGLGALAMGYGSKFRSGGTPSMQPVFSFDIRPESVYLCRRLASHLGYDHVHFEIGTSADANMFVRKGELGLGFIDGGHAADECLTDLENLHPLLGTYGKLLVHDFPTDPKLRYANGVYQACQTFIDSNPQYHIVFLGHGGAVIGSFANNLRSLA
jgi:predicted O-methyltransferase YrrM